MTASYAKFMEIIQRHHSDRKAVTSAVPAAASSEEAPSPTTVLPTVGSKHSTPGWLLAVLIILVRDRPPSPAPRSGHPCMSTSHAHRGHCFYVHPPSTAAAETNIPLWLRRRLCWLCCWRGPSCVRAASASDSAGRCHTLKAFWQLTLSGPPGRQRQALAHPARPREGKRDEEKEEEKEDDDAVTWEPVVLCARHAIRRQNSTNELPAAATAASTTWSLSIGASLGCQCRRWNEEPALERGAALARGPATGIDRCCCCSAAASNIRPCAYTTAARVRHRAATRRPRRRTRPPSAPRPAQTGGVPPAVARCLCRRSARPSGRPGPP